MSAARPSLRASKALSAGLVLLVAAAFRLTLLGSQPTRYADEFNCTLDQSGRFALLPGMTQTPVPVPAGVSTIAGDLSWVHPPLAKTLIAWSERPGSFTPISWRFPAAVFGILGVAVVYALAFAFWRSIWWASLAGLLVAEDGLHIVQSRTAMLDIFMTTFMALGLMFLIHAWRA